jgi:hypothetical protein
LEGVDVVRHYDDVGGVGDDVVGPRSVSVRRQQQHHRAEERLIRAGADRGDAPDAFGAGACRGLW